MLWKRHFRNTHKHNELNKYFLVCYIYFSIVSFFSVAYAQTWVDDTFEDFSKGKFDASGQNIYVSRDGKIRNIHRFDLNDDGYVDLLFNSSHDIYSDVTPTIATVSSNRHVHFDSLLVDGSSQAEFADLNNDGWFDVVFCPNGTGIQHGRHRVSIIWGGEDGLSSNRINGNLPGKNIQAIALADLNHDGWKDIVTLNSSAWLYGQPSGRIVRIFWGGERGFKLTNQQDDGVPGVISMVSGDFDSDGADDVAFLKSDKTVLFFWAAKYNKKPVKFETSELALEGEKASCMCANDVDGDGEIDIIIGTGSDKLYIVHGRSGRAWGEVNEIIAFEAMHIAVGDIDGDSYKDIVLSKSSSGRGGAVGGATLGLKVMEKGVNILWGSDNGFRKSRSTAFDIQFVRTSAIGDFDSDGKQDIAFSVFQGKISFSAESVIFYGAGKRQFIQGEEGIPTAGATYVLSVPPEKDLPARVIFCNSIGGTIDEKVPLLLYWGSSKGFGPPRGMKIPFRSGYESTAADLNADGFVDLIAMSSMHGGQKLEEDPTAGINIFWGNRDGIDFLTGPGERRTILNESKLGSSNVADLNRDGYLDLVVGMYNSNIDEEVIIYYGSKDGYNRSNRVGLDCPQRSLSIQIADYNKDGWLDLAANSYNDTGIRLFYNSPDGFDENRVDILDVPGVSDQETADLNGDGWLDMIVCSYKDIIDGVMDMGVTLLWGGPDGFKLWNSQWLPSYTALGPCAADFDNDGFLDIFLPNYHNQISREQTPSYLYWGGPKGFHYYRRTSLIVDSGSDAVAADFNGDGLIDLAVNAHTRKGNHNTMSKVFYNDGNRFYHPDFDDLPTHGGHWMWNEDIGHIYDRSYKQTYQSTVFECKRNAKSGKISYDAEISEGSKLLFAVRSSSIKSELAKKKWEYTKSGEFQLKKKDRFLQYQVMFISDNGDRFTVLDKITISVNPN